MQPGTSVQIGNIDKELKRLWEEQKKENRIRASLFNMIVFVKDKKRMEYIQTIIKAVIARFPCRIILIEQIESASSLIKVNVSNALAGKGNIVCDYIHIETTKDHLNRVPFIILPHVLPDLPLYLFWGVDPLVETEILPLLLPHAARLIFDSECIVNLEQFSKNIKNLIDLHPHIEFVDLNGLMISGWKNLFVRIFDSAELIEQLQQSRTIEIIYNEILTDTCKRSDIQAIFLINWLAKRLGWQLLSKEKNKFIYQNGIGKEVEVQLRAEQRNEYNPALVLGIEVASYNDRYYSILPLKDSAKVVVKAFSTETCDLPYTLPLLSLNRNFPYARDLIYSDVLA